MDENTDNEKIFGFLFYTAIWFGVLYGLFHSVEGNNANLLFWALVGSSLALYCSTQLKKTEPPWAFMLAGIIGLIVTIFVENQGYWAGGKSQHLESLIGNLTWFLLGGGTIGMAVCSGLAFATEKRWVNKNSITTFKDDLLEILGFLFVSMFIWHIIISFEMLEAAESPKTILSFWNMVVSGDPIRTLYSSMNWLLLLVLMLGINILVNLIKKVTPASNNRQQKASSDEGDYKYDAKSFHGNRQQKQKAKPKAPNAKEQKKEQEGWSEKDVRLYEYFKMRRDDPSSSFEERMKCQKEMMSIENKYKKEKVP